MTRLGWLVMCLGLLLPSCALAQANSPAPTYWKQRLFFIPYQVNQRSKLLDPIAKVQLLTSRTGANDWSTLEEAEPNVQGFSYHAPEDGEYWFALRHLDRRGQPWPSADVRPQMRLIVDTQQPELTLEGTPDATGEMVIRYEARDANLRPDTLMLEVRGVSNDWSPLRLGKPDVSQSNRLVGRVRWRAPSRAESIDVRAAITDQAGHRAQSETKVMLHTAHHDFEGPALTSPLAKTNPSARRAESAASQRKRVDANPFSAVSRLPSQDWPSSNRLPSTQANASPHQSPPPSNPYTVAGQQPADRTHAKLIADGLSGQMSRTNQNDNGSQSLQITPLGPDNAPPLVASTPWPSPDSENSRSQNIWSSSQQAADQASRVVNARTFDIEYDLQSVGPWGVSKVELWGTQDNGLTWRSFAVDPDNRSPVRVTVPEAGTFGFRILVDGANRAGSVPPQTGDSPELTVSVDLQPPAAKLLATELGQGNLADHLHVRWEASDTNLEPRPIALFYSSYPNGPWSTIASGLENTGSYTWRIERHVPARFYLRLEARDIAGNQATYQSSSPIALARPQPTGRLRGVRPITDRDRP